MVAFLRNGRKSRTDIDAYGRDNRKLVKLRTLCVLRLQLVDLRVFITSQQRKKNSQAPRIIKISPSLSVNPSGRNKALRPKSRE